MFFDVKVATVLTACGIETLNQLHDFLLPVLLQQCLPLAVLKPENASDEIFKLVKVATVLTACCIETSSNLSSNSSVGCNVATVLTACGIETSRLPVLQLVVLPELQQCLPLAVLKPLKEATTTK